MNPLSAVLLPGGDDPLPLGTRVWAYGEDEPWVLVECEGLPCWSRGGMRMYEWPDGISVSRVVKP